MNIVKRIKHMFGEIYLKCSTAYLPVNLRKKYVTDKQLLEESEYAIKIASGYIKMAVEQKIDIKGKRILEVGPGSNLGTPICLSCHGAKVMAVDRYPIRCDVSYDKRFYKALKHAMQTNNHGWNVEPINMLIENPDKILQVVDYRSQPLERLAGINDESVDIVFSNAVLEHLYNPEKAVNELCRITVPGGYGFHQVDHRDHRDFNRPLEYLLMEDEIFNQEFHKRHGECGNRLRPAELKNIMVKIGFKVSRFIPTIYADKQYIEDLISRLRHSTSRYSNLSTDELRIISGRYELVRTK